MKKALSFLSLLAIVVIPTFYNSCASYHTPGSEQYASALGDCEAILELAFAPMHEMLVDKCSNCHISGGTGSGAFAEGDISLAFQAFYAKGFDKVVSFAVNEGHQAPFSGPDNQPAVDESTKVWEEAQPTYNACVLESANNGGGGGGPGGGSDYEKPTIFTNAKPITANLNQVTTMTFNLDTELPNSPLSGAQFLVDVQEFFYDTTQTSGYFFSNPRLVAGGEAAFVKNIGVVLDGKLIGPPSGQTWLRVERYIPAGQERAVSPSGGTMQVAYDTTNTPQFAIAFGEIKPAGFNFQPSTFAQLSQSVFNSCTGCHSANRQDGGVDMSNYNRLIGVVGSSGITLVVPFQPSLSLVHSRMNDNASPMPTAGLLGEADRTRVEHWILDGAPR